MWWTATPKPQFKTTPKAQAKQLVTNARAGIAYDACNYNQRNQDNFSIFSYNTDSTQFINKSRCNDYTPPFINYIPKGIDRSTVSVDTESDLYGLTRNNTRCASKKYIPKDPSLAERVSGVVDPTSSYSQYKACTADQTVLPNGYLVRI